jgi:hypothetical protein
MAVNPLSPAQEADNRRMRPILFFLLISFFSPFLAAQDNTFETVRGQYRSLSLGMSLDAAKEALKKDSYFAYRGEADVTMYNNPNENIIDCRGTGFIARAWLQFREGNLFIIELEMDPQKIDYFTIYSQLTGKYGEPGDMTPQYASWASEDTVLSLEYPLTVKYLDRVSFEASLDESRVRDSYRETSRSEFAQEF